MVEGKGGWGDLVMLNMKLTNNSKMKWLFTERGSKEYRERWDKMRLTKKVLVRRMNIS